MRFKIERPYFLGEDVLSKYPILMNYNPIIDYPYENKNTKRVTIELKSIEDLVRLHTELDQELIIGNEDYCFNDIIGGHYSILIYDDYIE